MLRFTILYLFYTLVLFVLFSYQSVVDIQTPYTAFLNPVASFLMNTFGIHATSSGVHIVLPTATFAVLFGCNGLEALLIYIAAVLAFRGSWKIKGPWILAGTLILIAINLIRLVLLAYVVEYHREYFDFMHDHITQDVMIFLAMVVFFLFVRRMNGVRT